MKQLFTIAILIIGAIGLFFSYTKPHFSNVNLLRSEISAYDNALKQVEEFENLKNSLLQEYNSFDPEEITRLEKMIPLNVDNVRLIIEMESIAASHGLEISDISFTSEETPDESTAAVVPEEEIVLEEGSPDVGALSLRETSFGPQSVTMTFSTEAAYTNFKSFMRDLERSLRVVDIESIGSEGAEDGLATYQVEFRTFWLGN